MATTEDLRMADGEVTGPDVTAGASAPAGTGLGDAQQTAPASVQGGSAGSAGKQLSPTVGVPGAPAADDTDEFTMFGFGC
jgi:hypothetical protein